MFDIEPFVHMHFPEAKPYGNPVTDLQVNCIFCVGEDTKGHLMVSLVKNAVHCFRCGYKANYVKFAMDVTGLPYHRVIGELYVTPSINKLTKESVYNSRETFTPIDLPEDFHGLYTVQTAATAMARKYMAKRGFSKDVCLRYNIGVMDSLPFRVVIPIEKGYYQARKIVDWIDPKYINPKSEARDILFNAKALDIYSEVVVCEGAFSSMAIGTNSIALIGKEATDEKCERIIASKVRHFIIALEPHAYSSMGYLMERLYRNGREVTVWNYSVGDPADPKGQFEILPYDITAKVLLGLQV